MSSLSTRLGLILNTTADPFKTSDYTDNSNLLDAKPGIHICTSGTRPTWGAAQTGMMIYETDTKLLWSWSGSAWERNIPKGFIATTQVTTDQSTSSTSYVTAVTNAVTVAGGGRRQMLIASGPGVFGTNGLTQVGVFRDAVLINEWYMQGWTGPTVEKYPRGLFATLFDQPSSGLRTYTIQFRAVSGIGGTSTLQATAPKPLSLTVVEV